MSTTHKDAALSTRGDKKPQTVLDYNAAKGGVDNLGKVTGTYSCRRMTGSSFKLFELVRFYYDFVYFAIHT